MSPLDHPDFVRVLEHDPDLVVVLDDELRFSFVNRAAATKLGAAAHTLIGRGLWDAFPSLRREPFESDLRRALAGGTASNVEHQASVSRNRYELQILPLSKGVLLRGHDVTAARHASEQRQSHELEAIGNLAGGIAHDFNNSLSVIFSYCAIVEEELSRRDPLYPYFKEIQAAAGHANDLTRQLLAFSRQQVLRPRTADLAVIVDDVTKMLRRLLGANISLTTHPHADLWKVRVDPAQIEQVLMNLVLNARDALPQGGNIVVSTDNVEIAAGDRTRDGLAPGHYVLLSVRDDGVGMDEATRSRVFEPFFSARELGKASGLGLATAFGIVKQSGGTLHVDSAPQSGSTFLLHLPRFDGEVSEREEAPSSVVARAPRGTETILLVEDEETVRRATSTILRRYGYRVLDAAAGDEALRIIHAQTEPIQLLLTDVVMPRMSGLDLAARVRVERPMMKVLLMSGYMDDAYARDGLLGPGIEFLAKPIAPSTLARKVREALES